MSEAKLLPITENCDYFDLRKAALTNSIATFIVDLKLFILREHLLRLVTIIRRVLYIQQCLTPASI